MKNQTLNTSATKNTLADMAVSMVANGDTITPAPIVPDVPEIDVAKIYDGLKTKERNADTKTAQKNAQGNTGCLLYTSPTPRDGLLSRMPSSA